MLVFQNLIVPAAKGAGMKVPPEDLLDKGNASGESTWDRNEYPHFFIFCILQLGRSMSSPTQHWENAKAIVKIPETDLRTMTAEMFIAAGVDLS